MYSELGRGLVTNQSTQTLGGAGECLRVGLGRGHGHGNAHVAIHHAAGALHQEIESPECIRLLENRAEIG